MTSVSGLFTAYPSSDSRMMGGEEASDELVDGKREWLRKEKVGVMGEDDCGSDDDEDCDRCKGVLGSGSSSSGLPL